MAAWNEGDTSEAVLALLIAEGLVKASLDYSDGMVREVYTHTEAGKKAGLTP